MTSRIARCIAAWSALGFVSASAPAQDEPALDNPELLADLSRFRMSSHEITAGQVLPVDGLTCDFIREAIVDHAFLDESGKPQLLLASFRTNWSGYKLFPNIVHRNSDGTWVRTIIPETQDAFRQFAKSGDGQDWLFLMDNVPESPGWEMHTVISRDGGRTWSYGESLRKVHYFDTIRYLRMLDGGAGTAVEHFDDDGFAPDDQVGYYVFETADWGETWSERRFLRVFDTSDYVDAFPIIVAMRESEERLSAAGLEGFASCALP